MTADDDTTERLAPLLRGERVLVTGGAGMVGSALVERLLELEAKPTILDDFSAYPPHVSDCIIAPIAGRARIVRGDIADAELVESTMADHRWVIHAAAFADVAGCIDDVAEDHRTNVRGTHNVLMAARERRPERLLFVSSASVYGDPAEPTEQATFSEAGPHVPLSTYGNSKLWGETQARLFHELYGVPTTSVRYFSVYGPGQVPKPGSHSWCVAIFTMQALSGVPLHIHGDGRQVRDFVYISDIVEGTLLGLVAPATAGRVFNLGTGIPTCINELVEQVGRRVGPVEIRHTAAKRGDPRGGAADTTRMEQLLEWRPAVPLADGLERYREWVDSHPEVIPGPIAAGPEAGT